MKSNLCLPMHTMSEFFVTTVQVSGQLSPTSKLAAMPCWIQLSLFELFKSGNTQPTTWELLVLLALMAWAQITMLLKTNEQTLILPTLDEQQGVLVVSTIRQLVP